MGTVRYHAKVECLQFHELVVKTEFAYQQAVNWTCVAAQKTTRQQRIPYGMVLGCSKVESYFTSNHPIVEGVWIPEKVPHDRALSMQTIYALRHPRMSVKQFVTTKLENYRQVRPRWPEPVRTFVKTQAAAHVGCLGMHVRYGDNMRDSTKHGSKSLTPLAARPVLVG